MKIPDNETQDSPNSEYEPPAVEYLGTLRDLTGGSDGPGVDDFVTGVS